MIDMRVSQQHGVYRCGSNVQSLVFVQIGSLLHAAVDHDVLVADFDKVA